MSDAPRPKIRILNILIAVLAIAAGSLLAFAGWSLMQGAALAGQAQAVRGEAAAALRARLSAEMERLDAQRRLPRVREAVEGNNLDGARAALAGDWVGIEAVEIHPADLSAAWNAVERFGYG
ncbi:MAG: hypothetical protein ACK4JC_11800, partial [Silanimonas lenta]